MLYNKYRPQSFEEVVGQDYSIFTLKKAIERKEIPHSIILSGSAGTGKTTIARILAKELKIDSFDVFEIDVASANAVEDARNLVKTSRVPPSAASKYKMYIMDECHMYTVQAQTALLKILEEPPKHCLFVMCTTEKNKLISTIRSRSLSLDLTNLFDEQIFERLEFVCKSEEIPYDKDALFSIVNLADGSMRNALSSLEMCRTNATTEYVIQALGIVDYDTFKNLSYAIAEGRLTDVLVWVDVLTKVHTSREVTLEYGCFIRDLFYLKSDETSILLTMSETRKKEMKELLKVLTVPFVFAMLDFVQLCNVPLETSNRALSLILEIELTKLTMKRKAWLKKNSKQHG